MGEASAAISFGTGNSKFLHTFLDDNPSVEFIRLQWVDYFGVLTGRVATKAWVLSLDDKEETLEVPSPISIGMFPTGSLNVEALQTGIDRMWPDWESARVLPYHPSHASVMCFIQEGEQAPVEGRGFHFDPRSRLRDIAASAKAKYDMDFLVGMEIEFYIMEEINGVLKPVKTVSNAWSVASIRNKYLTILEEIAQAFQAAGIKVRQFHSEGDSGAFEISTEPLPPLQAADALYFCQETIKGICASHGLHATMFPKPVEKGTIIGAHYHISISQKSHEDSFLAGLLASWRALAGFYMPNFDSHERVLPGERISWGLQNKSCTIRKIRSGHWELRGPDATANSYLALLGIITAGLAGLESKKKLTMKSNTKICFPKPLNDEDAKEMGITDRMPTSLAEALESLGGDEVLKAGMGGIVERYVKVKGIEMEKFGGLTPGERRDLGMSLW